MVSEMDERLVDHETKQPTLYRDFPTKLSR